MLPVPVSVPLGNMLALRSRKYCQLCLLSTFVFMVSVLWMNAICHRGSVSVSAVCLFSDEHLNA